MATTSIPYKRFWNCGGFPTSFFNKLRKLKFTWKSKLIIPYTFSKFRNCSNLKINHELQMIFATLVVALLLLPSVLTCMLFQASPWYCCWSTMNYIFYYILRSYCCHPWWIVELQVPLFLLVLYCCNSIVIVIDATLLSYYCHPWQPINSSKQPNYEETINKNS